jgi:predicted AlkP superfamily phosphohydrolase/phosphomutase
MMALFLLIVGIFCSAPSIAHAYIGPGAGFAFLGSGFVFFLTIFMGLVTVMLWPVQWIWRKASGKGIPKKARTRRVIILGLDGLEPSLVEKYISEGKLPHLQSLKNAGTYSHLGTTLPALSPVAWSTFQTGVNPGSHNIFDFLTRDKRTCLPDLSSTEIEKPQRTWKLGPLQLCFGRPRIRILRKSRPFWKILGDQGISSNIIRVPISYPPERFDGNILSAMCTPDVRGTQGTFSFFSTRQDLKGQHPGGEFQELRKNGNLLEGEILGPPDPRREDGQALKVPFTLEPVAGRAEVRVQLGGQKLTLKENVFSDWIELRFRFGWRKSVSGICRLCLREAGSEVSLYVSPVNVNPEKPALPISHPIFFASWLAKRQGLYGTLGLMEDTWGRNEHALSDAQFLQQTYLTHAEREQMFFDALDRTREGVCACVFDASDRIQHMFWRYLDDAHPSPREDDARFRNTIPEMYQKMDELVGRMLKKIRPQDVVIVLSDHGFTSFRRGVNINTWLQQQGYLAVKDGKVTGADYLQDVDWSKTKAFGLGLSGIYLNRKGRERFGILGDDEAEKVKQELTAKLQALKDPQGAAPAIRRVYDTAKAYHGLYTEEAPDLIVGYAPGYRVSWDSVTGMLEPEVFTNNVKAWSGDHHVDPVVIPGVFFCNLPLKSEKPHIADIAPTVLDLFGVKVPGYMEGKVIV